MYSKLQTGYLRFVAALLAASSFLLPGPQVFADSSKKINGDRDTNRPPGEGALGRANWKAVPADYSDAKVNTWVAADQAKNPGWKYVYLPQDAVGDAEMANTLRVAIFKAWNHLSWKPEVDLGREVSEGHGLVFAIKPDAIWPAADVTANWSAIATCKAKSNISISPAPRGDCERFEVDGAVAAPRFVYNATNGGPYANVFKTPPNFSAFRRQYQMGELTATATHKSAIVCGPRITSYAQVQTEHGPLLYSFTSDEFNGRDNGNINYKNAPTKANLRSTGALVSTPNGSGVAIASEWWIQLPNGFLYYGIHGEGSQERGKAEYPFAIDPANWKQGHALATGRSCITCHASGIQALRSDDEYAGKNGWTSNEDLAVLYKQSQTKFRSSMQKIVAAVSSGDPDLQKRLTLGTIEPVARAIMLVEGKYRSGNTGSCRSFCGGKYGPSRGNNLCELLPAR